MYDCDVIYISDQNGDQTQVLAKLGHDLGWQKSMPDYNKSNATTRPYICRTLMKSLSLDYSECRSDKP